MKTLFLSIFLFLTLSISSPERFQANYMSTRICKSEICEEWLPWEVTDVIITVDTTKEVHIYSKSEQIYTIISIIEYNDNNLLRFDCLDISNVRCTIEILHFKEKGDHLYIRWSDYQIVYQMKKI